MKPVLTTGCWRVAGLAVVLLSLLPIGRWINAVDQGPVWAPHVGVWAIGGLVVVIVAVIAGRLAADVQASIPSMPPAAWRAVPAGLAVAVAAFAAIAMREVFSGNPHLIDEVAQLFQGRIFASGRLAAPDPVPLESFLVSQTLVTDAGWVSQYPPGQSVLLALGFWARAEWLVNPILGGISVMLLFAVARGLYDLKTATVAALLWSTSAWVLFMSATYMNHVGATTLALGAWAVIWAPRQTNRWHYVGAGFLLAAAAATRPLDAVAVAVPIGVWLIRQRGVAQVPWIALGALPVAGAWGVLNWRLFGSPFTLGYTAHYGSDVGLGFQTDPFGHAYTPLVALSNMAAAVRRLNIYLFEWPIPALLPLTAWALFGRRHANDVVIGIGALAAPALYFFYWHSGFYPGPRFYYISAPFLVIATARAWGWVWTHAIGKKRWGVRWDVSAAVAAAVVLLWGLLSFLPARWDFYRTQLVSLKHHPERELAARGVDQALVIVPESWGSRVVVRLWGLGAPATLVERAINRVDTCELHELGRRAKAAGQQPSAIVQSLSSFLAANESPVAPIRNWPDPSLRLRQWDSIPADCNREMQRDLRGFTLYGHLAWRNAVGLDSGVVFARDLYEDNAELFARFEDWQVWRYAPPVDDPTGEPVLTLVRSELEVLR